MPKISNTHQTEKVDSYEYLIVKEEHSFTKMIPVPKNELPEGVEEGYKKDWEYKIYIHRPNESEPKTAKSDSLFKVINELGSEGWKLKTNNITYSAVYLNERYGGSEVGTPLVRQLIFMRKRKL